MQQQKSSILQATELHPAFKALSATQTNWQQESVKNERYRFRGMTG